jgi:hypothetical protein
MAVLTALLATCASGAAAAGSTARPKTARNSMVLSFPDAFSVGGAAVMVPNRYIHVHGVVRPYVAGQKVLVRAYLGRRLIARDTVRIRRSKNGRYGYFNDRLVAHRPGDVLVQVTHGQTRLMNSFGALRRYQVLSENVGPGSRGTFVQLIQQRLRALHFYLIESGVYDSYTGLAIDAYHRLLGWGTSQRLDAATVRFLLNGWGQFKVRFPNQGRHAEGNLARQVLALINGSQVYALYPISSGKPSTPTILGQFHVYSKVPGYLPDGMFFSNFFTGGYAIHGYNPAPDYPASHGCMRLPIQDAISVYNWLQIGNGVDTYY